MMRTTVLLCLWLCAALAPAPAQTQARPPDRVLSGELTAADHQTFHELAFEVPAGVTRLRIDFDYDRSQGTVIDLGVRDPQRLRGWSGGNKDSFELAESDATPSYLAGPIPAGTWHLLLGIPNHRAQVITRYRAAVYFGVESDAVLIDAPGWYRGDFHAHSGHSDGYCFTQSGAKGPCPIYRTVEAAAARRLDFVSLTEHNTVSHRQGLTELQGVFDRVLLIAGMELTTFKGHANLFGPLGYPDFPGAAQDMSRIAALVRESGGLFSINHPGLPSDERCMGCGWTAAMDRRLIDAVEIVNGGAFAAAGGRVDSALSGIPFWESLLDAGHRVTAIGGSDNHDPLKAATEASAVGQPTTVVYASALSQTAILEGVRSGRVFLDVEGTADRMIDLAAEAGSRRVSMGDQLTLPPDTPVLVRIRVRNTPGAFIVLIRNGQETILGQTSAVTDEVELQYSLLSGGERNWFRVEARAEDGNPMLISNPIILEPSA